MIARIVFVASAALALIVWAGLGIDRASAHEPHPGLQLSIGVDGLPGCDTRRGDVTCTLPAGSTFVIDVSLDSLPPDIPSYLGFDLFMRYEGVTPLQDASNAAWPDCGFPARSYQDDLVGFGCAIGVPPAGPSTYTGLMGTNSFVCAQSGSVTLLHGAEVGYTDLVEGVTQQGDDQIVVSHSEGVGVSETINVICGKPPTATATPVVLPFAGQIAHSGHGPAPWLIGMLLASGAALIGTAAVLRARRA